MESITNQEETLVNNTLNLTLLEKGKLAFLKNQEEKKDKQIELDKAFFEKLIKLANDRFGGEFSWSQSKQEDYYIITNIEERFALGSLINGGLQYVKKCEDCKQLINSVEVYLHDLPLVKDGTIRFNHNCKDKQVSPNDLLLSALGDFVADIVESYQN